MHILLTLIFSFYPATFLYRSIPSTWTKSIDQFAPTGTNHFFAQALIYIALFALSYIALNKFTSLGYRRSRGVVNVILMTVFSAALILIAFYIVLPGGGLYGAPAIVNKYLLTNPYLFIALVAPLAYLFFD